MITLKTAVQYLADGTQDCAIPLDPHAFRRKGDSHEHLYFGHIPIRGYKNAGRWKFDERDIRRATREITALPWDPDDLTDAKLPGRETLENRSALDEAGLLRPDWRGEIRRIIQYAARQAVSHGGCECAPERCTGPEVGPDGLPCGLTRQALLQRCGDHTIACTQPIPTLRWDGETWLIPRTLRRILDGWQKAQNELTTAAGCCSGCGARGNVYKWRAATVNGWKILCPPCASATLRPYQEQLKGVAYTRIRERGPSAEDFLCVLCENAHPAAHWDHCHDHGLVRGPLCGGCNGMEWQGKEFLNRRGSITHLLRCIRCRAEHAVPRHHRPAAVRQYVHDQVATGCTVPTYAEIDLTEREDGGYDYTLLCFTTHIRQTGTVSASEVRDVLDRLLAE